MQRISVSRPRRPCLLANYVIPPHALSRLFFWCNLCCDDPFSVWADQPVVDSVLESRNFVWFGAGKSKFRLIRCWKVEISSDSVLEGRNVDSLASYQDLINWYNSLLTRPRCTEELQEHTQNTKTNRVKWNQKLYKTQSWRYKTTAVIKHQRQTTISINKISFGSSALTVLCGTVGWVN